MKNIKLSELFSLRIGRLKYFVQFIIIATLFAVQDEYGVFELLFGSFLANLLMLMLMLYFLLLVIQRLNDLDWSRWIVLAPLGAGLLVSVVPPSGMVAGPLLVIFLGIPLLFRRGKKIDTNAIPEIRIVKDRTNFSSTISMVYGSVVRHKTAIIIVSAAVLAIVVISSFFAYAERDNPAFEPGVLAITPEKKSSVEESKSKDFPEYEWKYFSSPDGDSFYVELPTAPSVTRPSYSTYCVMTCSTSPDGPFRSTFSGVTLTSLYLFRSLDDTWGFGLDFPRYTIETGHISTTRYNAPSPDQRLKLLYDAYVSGISNSSSRTITNKKVTTLSASASLDGTHLDYFIYESYVYSSSPGEIQTNYGRGRIILNNNNLYLLTTEYDNEDLAEKYAKDFEKFVSSFGIKAVR